METNNETLAPPLGEGLTFEKVWAAFMELKASQKVMGEETDRRIQETAQQMKVRSEESDQRMQEHDRRMQEIDKQRKVSGEKHEQRMQEIDKQKKISDEKHDKRMQEIDKQTQETAKLIQENARLIKRIGKQVGKITNCFGEMVEHMVAPNLLARFKELDFTFTKAGLNTKIADKTHNIFTEFDAFLENGDKVMIVETKTKPDKEDIQNHIERLKKLRIYADLHADKRKYMGAIAGVVFGNDEKDYALSNGFYVLEPSGKTFAITTPASKGHTPQEW
jgi:hypothetical protein